MDSNTRIKIANRDSGSVFYAIPEKGVRRVFAPRETKTVTFEELESLSYQPGGLEILKNFLIIRDREAAAELLPDVEPEYFYDKKDVAKLLTQGSYEQLLDCLDFAPTGVIDLVKTLSVDLPLQDMRKRQAILRATGFDVTNAINVQNMKYDGEEEKSEGATAAEAKPVVATRTRRVTAPIPEVTTEKAE